MAPGPNPSRALSSPAACGISFQIGKQGAASAHTISGANLVQVSYLTGNYKNEVDQTLAGARHTSALRADFVGVRGQFRSAVETERAPRDLLVLRLVVRTSGDPLTVAAAVQAVARRLDPRIVIDRVTTMDAIVSRAVAPWRFSAWMFTAFAVLAFGLVTVGRFSLVSLDVAHRGREFAVRVALGARRRDIQLSVLRSALWRIVPAITLGALAASGSARAIRHILFQADPLDPAVYLSVMVLVSVVVAAASWLPAHRAASADPLTLLRGE